EMETWAGVAHRHFSSREHGGNAALPKAVLPAYAVPVPYPVGRLILQPQPLRLALLGLLVSSAAAAQGDAGNALYRCRDDNGVTSYQQQPCDKNQKAAGEVRYSADPDVPAPPPAPTAPAAPAPAPPA